MTLAILTIAYVLAVCALIWFGHRHELAVHDAEQRERKREPEGLGSGEVKIIQHAEEVDHA